MRCFHRWAIRFVIVLFSLFLGIAGSATIIPASAMEIRGTAVQGALLIIRATPGARATLEGRPLRVSPEGMFLIGFGRDDTRPVQLVVSEPDGGETSLRFTPAPRPWLEQRVDGLPPAKVTPDPETQRRIEADNARLAAARQHDGEVPFFLSGFDWPVRGRVTGVFGSRRILNGEPRAPHRGLDIQAPPGTPVAAMADGEITLVRPDMELTGMTVMVDHGHGLMSVYAHMSEITVAEGQRIGKGAIIGRVGASGRASGPHLHWGVSLFEVALDPALLLDDGDAAIRAARSKEGP